MRLFTSIMINSLEKLVKKSVVLSGQVALELNHQRRMLCYRHILKDKKKRLKHLKDNGDLFKKEAKSDNTLERSRSLEINSKTLLLSNLMMTIS